MSYAGKRYADYTSFISPIFPVTPGHNYWDKTPKTHTVEEIILFSEEGTCLVFCNGITYLTTAALADDFHMGKTKLETDFKKCTGYTIHAFR